MLELIRHNRFYILLSAFFLTILSVLVLIMPTLLPWVGFGVIGLLLIFAALWKPEIFLILGLWTNFLKGVYIPHLAFGRFGVAPYMLFTTLAVIGYGARFLSGQEKIILPPGLLFLSVFFLGITYSSLFVKDIYMTLGGYARDVLQWIQFFLLIQMVENKKKFHKLINVLLIQAYIVIPWGIVTGIQINYLGIDKNKLLFWNQLQKNEYAVYLGFVLVLAIAIMNYTFQRRSLLTKILASLLILSVPIAWMFTYSRSGFLAIIVSFFVYIILDRGKKMLRNMVRWGPVVILVVILMFIALSSEARALALDGLLSLISPFNVRFERHTANIIKRIDLITNALKVIKTHPLTGVDYSQWLSYSPLEAGRYDPQLGERVVTGQSVHNRFLSTAVQAGLITLAAYVGFVLVMVMRAMEVRQFTNHWQRVYLNAMLASLIGFQVALLFLPVFLWEWPIMGVLLGLLRIIASEEGVREGRQSKAGFQVFRIV